MIPQVEHRNKNISCAMIRIEILSFFLANPHTRGTVKGLSSRLFMNCEMVARVMEDLIEVGIIEKGGNNEQSIYKLKVSYSTLTEI